jgi:hypothetical protein
MDLLLLLLLIYLFIYFLTILCNIFILGIYLFIIQMCKMPPNMECSDYCFMLILALSYLKTYLKLYFKKNFDI